MKTDYIYVNSSSTGDVLAEIDEERRKQDAVWGEQNHANGTGAAYYRTRAEALKREYAECAANDRTPTWRLILEEEVMEAFSEVDEDLLYEELKQVAAVAVAQMECINRKRNK